MNPDRAALAHAYESAVYTADLPAGRIELRVGQPPQGSAPRGTMAIITAWNPGTERPCESDNIKANERLRAALREGGWTLHPASARARDGSHAEPSFAVPGIGADSALALARQFDQAAILFWDGVAARLLWCDAQAQGKL